jgi:hypothetical protein
MPEAKGVLPAKTVVLEGRQRNGHLEQLGVLIVVGHGKESQPAGSNVT